MALFVGVLFIFCLFIRLCSCVYMYNEYWQLDAWYCQKPTIIEFCPILCVFEIFSWFVKSRLLHLIKFGGHMCMQNLVSQHVNSGKFCCVCIVASINSMKSPAYSSLCWKTLCNVRRANFIINLISVSLSLHHALHRVI